jgi:hypothetical protein
VNELLASGEPLPEEASSIFGEWAVTGVIGATSISAMSAEDQASWIGTQASYMENRAAFGSEAMDAPTYEPFVLSHAEFLREYNVSPETLGWESDFVTGVRIMNWLAPGSLLFLYEDSLVTLWDGVFFELERVPERSQASE